MTKIEMTNEEAIKILKGAIKKPNTKDGYLGQALDMGIKALEQQPCEDCISREEVRRVLGNEVFELMKIHTTDSEDNPKADAMAHGVNWSLNTLMELPSVQPQPRWIPVSERLPETQDCYLVTTKWKGSYSGNVYIETNMAVYREKPKEWDCVDVIAWQPLPEPYKEDNNDK